MNGVLALTVLCIIFAFGDIVSAKTKSLFSMMFVASLILLIGFWTGLPKTIFDDSGLKYIGTLLIGFLITHMGTLMSFEDLKKQWKTVVIALGAVVGIGVFLFVVGTPILGREYAIAAAPPISGGIVAALIMGEKATALGLDSIAVFATLLVVVQGFFGYPIASILLNKEAKTYLKNMDEFPEEKAEDQVEVKEKKKLLPQLPAALQTPYVLMAKLGIAVLISFKLSELTNGVVHAYVVCLLVGIVLKEIGFLEEEIMTKANSFGLGMIALMAVIFANLSTATPAVVMDLLFPLVASLSLSVVGIAIASILLGKLLGYSIPMSVSIGVSALFGFPGTFIISNEVANAVSKNEEERQAVLNHILPKMLVAGFMTVTIASVVLAGFMVKLL